MRRILLGLLILGALASALLVLGASRAGSSSNSSPGLGTGLAATAGLGTTLYSLKLVDSDSNDASTSTAPSASELSAPAEGYELTISYRDSSGNEFTLIKPLNGEPASIQARFSQSFWQRKLEPLLRSIGALFTISVER